MTSKAGHTAGPCRPGEVRFAGKYQLVLDERSSGYVCEVAAPLVNGEFDEAVREARAHLIAEAFTVAHETGLTPRQLAEQRDELVKALQWALAELDKSTSYAHPGQFLACDTRARAAIAKATAGGAV